MNGVIDMVKLVQNIGIFPRLVELRPFLTLRGLIAPAGALFHPPTSDLYEKARSRLEGPGTHETPQNQAHQRDATIPAPPPLVTVLPHPSWWGTWGGSPFSPVRHPPAKPGKAEGFSVADPSKGPFRDGARSRT